MRLINNVTSRGIKLFTWIYRLPTGTFVRNRWKSESDYSL